jgi:hypothetical protein
MPTTASTAAWTKAILAGNAGTSVPAPTKQWKNRIKVRVGERNRNRNSSASSYPAAIAARAATGASGSSKWVNETVLSHSSSAPCGRHSRSTGNASISAAGSISFKS